MAWYVMYVTVLYNVVLHCMLGYTMVLYGIVEFYGTMPLAMEWCGLKLYSIVFYLIVMCSMVWHGMLSCNVVL